MKKGLLLALGVSTGFALSAQAPKVGGVVKADLTNSKTITTDGSSVNFFSSANAAQRNVNPASTQTVGTHFSSSYNAFTLLVSQSNCLTANQALNVAMFTHRISQDWAADANVASGYGEYSWTTDCGATWDSTYYNDNTVLGNQRFRYPSGAIINPAGNTSIANAYVAGSGPWTDGSGWGGWYTNYQAMDNASSPGNPVVTDVTTLTSSTVRMAWARIDAQSCSDSTYHVAGSLYTTPSGAAPAGYTGVCLVKGQKNGSTVTFSYDSIKPNFHLDGTGTPDCWTDAHLAFSADGTTGYCVWFGSEATASTPATRSYIPIVYKTTNSGASWTMLPLFDYTTIPAIANNLIAGTGGLKPWFSQGQGSDVVVDNNGQLHILSVIESGSSDDNDSLGYAYTLTGQSGTTARHYIYDTYTTANTWNSVLVDSLMTTTSTNTTIFVDGSNSGAAFPTDARIQISSNATRDHLFYLWSDSDPLALSGENALPDLYGKGVDLTTNSWTARKQFTTSQDFYFQYVSNNALSSGSTFSVPVTNSIDRSGSHDVATTFDHYFSCFTFDQSEFVGVEEHNATFGSFTTSPNPAHEMFNINLDLVNNSNVTITVMNAMGQVVKTENRDLNKGANSIQVNTSDLSAGIYFVNVASDASSATAKVVIQ